MNDDAMQHSELWMILVDVNQYFDRYQKIQDQIVLDPSFHVMSSDLCAMEYHLGMK